jgi:hypothetical protein
VLVNGRIGTAAEHDQMRSEAWPRFKIVASVPPELQTLVINLKQKESCMDAQSAVCLGIKGKTKRLGCLGQAI